ncbi:Transmembrane transporter [Exophiala dermatitidis]
METSKDSGLQYSEAKMDLQANPSTTPTESLRAEVLEDDGEVFKGNAGHAQFRALGLIPTIIVLIKLCFATGVLSIPAALGVVGYGPGLVLLALWSALTMYYAFVMYQFRMKYKGIHNIVDAAMLMGGPIAREATAALFLLTWTLCTGSGFVGLSQGLKILANGKGCTIVWTLVAAIATGLLSSIRTLGKLALLTWVGFASIFTAVFIVVIGVTVIDRPAAAPQEGPLDLGVIAVGSPGFVAGLVAGKPDRYKDHSCPVPFYIPVSGFGSTSTFMPVMAEMKVPRTFPKALFISQGLLVACYISFGMVVYIYCGVYVASPSLGSAGGTLMKVAYGVSIPGFIMTSTLWVHIAAKFLFVRILRDSEHLQSNSFRHWATWL